MWSYTRWLCIPSKETPTNRAVSAGIFAKTSFFLTVLICYIFVKRILILWQFFLLIRRARYKNLNGWLQSYFMISAELYCSFIILERYVYAVFSFQGEETYITLDKLSWFSYYIKKKFQKKFLFYNYDDLINCQINIKCS